MSPESRYSNLPLSIDRPIECTVTGTALLNTPILNKGSAFTLDERCTFNLTGLVPQGVQTLDQQCRRAYKQYLSRGSDLAKNEFLTSLKDQNEVLYYKVTASSLLDKHVRLPCQAAATTH